MRFPRELPRFAIPFVLLALLGFVACTAHQNPEQLKENTARATAELKDNAKAVAAGVKEGLSRGKAVDINTAPREELMALPEVTAADANRVIAGRPYDDPSQLVTRRIIAQSKYDKIADQLTAKK